jgi:hypothetical protein
MLAGALAVMVMVIGVLMAVAPPLSVATAVTL